jgi:hypothetical protein
MELVMEGISKIHFLPPFEEFCIPTLYLKHTSRNKYNYDSTYVAQSQPKCMLLIQMA